MRKIVILGSNGFAKEVLCLINDINQKQLKISDKYDILGFINNEPATWGTFINDIPVLGDESWILNYSERLYCAMGIGRPALKKKIIENLKDRVIWPNLIHPNVVYSKWIDMGIGNIITAGNILTCNIRMGNHNMINLLGTIGHDTTIEDYVVVSPGVNISGNVYIKEGAYIGTGAKILEQLSIGRWSTIGGAALINKNVPDNATMVGVPAKVIKQKQDGWHL